MGRIGIVSSEEELAFLRRKVSSGVSSAREIAHARVLLGSHEGLPRDRAAREAGVSQATPDRIRSRFAEGGLEAALARRTQPPRPAKRKLTDETEARLIALACSEAPEGRARWTLRLLADKAVELGVLEGGLSHESARAALERTSCVLTGSPAG
jgi:transposase